MSPIGLKIPVDIAKGMFQVTIIKEESMRLLAMCAFCGGEGKDPFGIMSRLSTCVVCGGEKAVWIEKTEAGTAIECLFCSGAGVSPTGARNACAVCDGVGVIWVEEPSQVCPHCGGIGWEPHISLYCVVCKGKGAIPVMEAVPRRRQEVRLCSQAV